MVRIILSALAALIVAGAVHALAVLSLPAVADNTLQQKIAAAQLAANAFHSQSALAETGISLGYADPNLQMAVCPIELSGGPVAVYAPLFSGYWSISIFDDAMNNVAVFNKSSFLNEATEIVVGTVTRGILLSSDDRIISVMLPDFTGYALVRLMPGHAYQQSEADNELASSRCAPWLN